MKKITGISVSITILIAAAIFFTWTSLGMVKTYADEVKFEETLDLQVNGGNVKVKIMDNLKNVVPGDCGNPYATIKNAGGLTGSLDVQFSQITNIGGKGGTRYEDGHGDLGEVAEIAPWIDMDEDEIFDPGFDIAFKSNCDFTTAARQWEPLNNFGNKTWKDALVKMGAGEQLRFYISWRIPETASNNIQGDSVDFGVNFTLKQLLARTPVKFAASLD